MKLICVPEEELKTILKDYKKYVKETIDEPDPREHYIYLGKVMLIEYIFKLAKDLKVN